MKPSRSDNRIETKLGGLIAAVSECTLDSTADTREAYDLAHLVFVELLKKANFSSKSLERYVPGTLLQYCVGVNAQ